ncbi:MAG: GYD domain-containing protein [Candidatus Methanoperedens sp.]|nr:GYD domain-containing protein [Candidatus Methanoperedens sp.]
MARYIITSTLTDDGAKTLKKNPGRIKEVNAELKEMGIQVLDQYVVLGNFDFMTIVESEDENKIFKAVVELLSRGSIRTATYRAIPVNEFIESLE